MHPHIAAAIARQHHAELVQAAARHRLVRYTGPSIARRSLARIDARLHDVIDARVALRARPAVAPAAPVTPRCCPT